MVERVGRRNLARYVLLAAILRFATDWHDGQRSRLYRTGCRARAALARMGVPDAGAAPLEHAPSAAERDVYARLLAGLDAYRT